MYYPCAHSGCEPCLEFGHRALGLGEARRRRPKKSMAPQAGKKQPNFAIETLLAKQLVATILWKLGVIPAPNRGCRGEDPGTGTAVPGTWGSCTGAIWSPRTPGRSSLPSRPLQLALGGLGEGQRDACSTKLVATYDPKHQPATDQHGHEVSMERS